MNNSATNMAAAFLRRIREPRLPAIAVAFRFQRESPTTAHSGVSYRGVVEKRFVNPPGLSPARGFAHVVIASGGRTVFVGGQVAYDGKGEVVGKGDLHAQTRQVYENLKLALAAAGATFADVVTSNAYVVNLERKDLAAIREVRSQYLPQQDPPASTVVGVAARANPDCLIEIEVIAVVK